MPGWCAFANSATALVCLLCVVTSTLNVGGVAAEAEENHPWEWAAAVQLVGLTPYSWLMQKANGAYADDTALFSLTNTSSYNDEGVHAVEDTVLTLWNTTATNVTRQTTLSPDTLYRLEFDTTVAMSTFYVQVPTTGTYVITFQHNPAEFENGLHYLKNAAGADVEGITGVHTDHAEGTSKNNKNTALLYTLLGNLICACVALLGILVFMFIGNEKFLNTSFTQFLNAFAAGALLGAAFFLIAPEALMILSSKKHSVTEAAGFLKWGAMLMAGCFVGALIHFFFCVDDHSQHDLRNTNTLPTTTTTTTTTTALAAPFGLRPIVWNILLGDGIHNVMDGITLAIAFAHCSYSTGWLVLMGTVAHEVPQEIADYLILTGAGGLKPKVALGLNFLSACTAVIAGLVTSLLSDDVDTETTAFLLAFSAGIYTWIGVQCHFFFIYLLLIG
jgi:zinc transporter ZupT